MSEIRFPQVTTYFISYENKNVFSPGIVQPTQEMVSGLPYLYQTTNKVEWLNELSNYNTYLGYVFIMEEDASDAQKDVNNYYGPNTCSYKYTTNNNPNFWYILGDYSIILGDPILFQIY